MPRRPARRRPSRGVRPWLVAATCLFGIGCSAQPQIVALASPTEGVRLTSRTDTLATETSLFANLPAETSIFASPAPDFISPSGDRPCCAFGYDFSIHLGQMTLPGLNIDNIVEASGIGAHIYGGPLESTRGSLSGGMASSEINGLVYSCHGGFIDIAHVRDYADWTVYLYYQLEPVLESGAVVHLDDEGSRRFVVVPPIDISSLAAR